MPADARAESASAPVPRRVPVSEQVSLLGSAYRAARRYLRVAQAAAWLIIAARRRGPAELWFGDSHAVFLNEEYTSSVLSRAPEGQIVWHIGPRLMWSLARNGFPRRVHLAARALRWWSRPGSIVPIFVTGEIDVRCHLVPRSTRPDFNLDFVGTYVDRAHQLAAELGAEQVVFVAPVPPSDDCPRNPQFPIAGSIDERIAVFDQLRDALAVAVDKVESGPRAVLFDATALLVDATGQLRSELTDDGCHTNRRGSHLVRAALRERDVAG